MPQLQVLTFLDFSEMNTCLVKHDTVDISVLLLACACRLKAVSQNNRFTFDMLLHLMKLGAVATHKVYCKWPC